MYGIRSCVHEFSTTKYKTQPSLIWRFGKVVCVSGNHTTPTKSNINVVNTLSLTLNIEMIVKRDEIVVIYITLFGFITLFFGLDNIL
jgi:hypothetical protein